MQGGDKPIRLSRHAQEQLRYRGASEGEVVEAIRTCRGTDAELNRLECRKNYAYKQYWNNRYYETKQIKPIFVEESNEIVVVTVYVYYF